MVAWAQRTRATDQATAEAQTIEYMRTMPAWRDHPRLAAEPPSRHRPVR